MPSSGLRFPLRLFSFMHYFLLECHVFHENIFYEFLVPNRMTNQFFTENPHLRPATTRTYAAIKRRKYGSNTLRINERAGSGFNFELLRTLRSFY